MQLEAKGGMNFGPSAGVKEQSDIADFSQQRQIRNMLDILVQRAGDLSLPLLH